MTQPARRVPEDSDYEGGLGTHDREQSARDVA
jgi:hypothetical protein